MMHLSLTRRQYYALCTMALLSPLLQTALWLLLGALLLALRRRAHERDDIRPL